MTRQKSLLGTFGGTIILFLLLIISQCAVNRSIIINFNTNGGNSLDPIELTIGETIDLPNPEKEGHTFFGWFEDSELNGEPFTFDSNPTQNLDLFAKWSINNYDITLFLFPEIEPEIQSITFHDEVVKFAAPIREGYTFENWYIDSQLLTPAVFPFSMPSNSLTFYAKWIANTYLLNFDTGGGIELSSQMVVFGNTITSLPTPVKEGHSFKDWYEDEGLTLLVKLPFTMPSRNVVFYAAWLIQQFSIEFETNGGNVITPLTQDYGSNVLALSSPTQIGFTFEGWFYDPELLQAVTFPFTLGANNITLHAKWSTNTYLLILNTNGGNALQPMNINFGSTISLPTPVKTGNSFKGWFTDEAMSTSFTLSTMPANNLTLYAKWEIGTYQIQYLSYQTQEVLQVASGQGQTIILTKDYQVYGIGHNDRGKVGDGTTTNRSLPVKLQFASLLEGEFVNQVFAGGTRSYAITSKGRVYGWGDNAGSRLGDGTNTNRLSPVLITFANLQPAESIQSLSSGDQHQLALTTNNRVYAWGEGDNGRLGTGNITDRTAPTLVTINGLSQGEKIVEINAAGEFSILRTSSNRIVSFGRNLVGQFGAGNQTDSLTPVWITLPLNDGENLIQLNARKSTVFTVTSIGRVFAWGGDYHGALGQGTTLVHLSQPTLVTIPNLNTLQNEKPININLGDSSVTLLTSTGRIFTWGKNTEGQLGDNSTVSKSSPQLLTIPGLSSGETIVSSGQGLFNNIVVSSKGRMWIWGTAFSTFVYVWDGLTAYQLTPLRVSFEDQITLKQETYSYQSSLVLYQPIRAGFTFIGWYTNSNLTTAYTGTTMPANGVTLYAKWQAN